MDKVTKDKRSEIMSRIRWKNTGIEMKLRKALFQEGARWYRLYRRVSRIRPDLVFVRKKIAVFVDGCFWHRCPVCFKMPKSRLDYWEPKLEANAMRDIANTEKLRSEWWMVLRFWEHEVKKELPEVVRKIKGALSGR